MSDRPLSLGDVRSFWQASPVATEGIAAVPGEPAFYAAFDALREAEGCEPYAVSESIHGYSGSAGLRVLDVGCGNGYVLSHYARHGADVNGVDLTEAAVELSRQRFALAGLKGNFTRIDGAALPFEDNSFDIVCSMGVLHHIPDPEPLVHEIHRVLRPGGRLIAMLYYRRSYNAVVATRLRRLFDPRFRGMTQQEALNRLDGPGCPLARVYSKAEAKSLLRDFEHHTFELNALPWRQVAVVPALARMMRRSFGSPDGSWLARQFGWNMYIKARKRTGTA